MLQYLPAQHSWRCVSIKWWSCGVPDLLTQEKHLKVHMTPRTGVSVEGLTWMPMDSAAMVLHHHCTTRCTTTWSLYTAPPVLPYCTAAALPPPLLLTSPQFGSGDRATSPRQLQQERGGHQPQRHLLKQPRSLPIADQSSGARLAHSIFSDTSPSRLGWKRKVHTESNDAQCLGSGGNCRPWQQ